MRIIEYCFITKIRNNKTKNQTRGMYSATYLPKGGKFLPGGNSRRRVMNEV